MATFVRDGFVPELEGAEAAMMLDRPIKAINLVVMGLRDKGAVQILKRNPLQLEIVDAERASTEAEQVLLDSLTDRGTLPKSGVQSVLEALNREGLTIVLITHEPDVAGRARRVLTVRDGRLEMHP